MTRYRIRNRLSRVEQEIVRKERMALDAKQKGMHATYGNYMMDISVLKTQLQKLSTGPARGIH